MALLVTIVTLMALTLIVAQTQLSTKIEYKQAKDHIRVRQLQRALDGAPGLAMRMLEEKVLDRAADSLHDEWARDKFFDVQLDDNRTIRLAIHIDDCAGKYNLKLLLEENPDTLSRNIEDFVAFAYACGLDELAANHLARAIADEADLHRTEDTVFTDQEEDQQEGQAQGDQAEDEDQTQQKQELVPLWLDDFLGLPALTDDDRYLIEQATIQREDLLDPEAPLITVRFVEQVTMWRQGPPNINTASREVLLHDVPHLRDKEEAVDEILERREEEPFQNVSQLGNISALTRPESRNLRSEVRLNSVRFRVTATATENRVDEFGEIAEPTGRQRTARTIMIIERRGGGQPFTLWRRTEP